MDHQIMEGNENRIHASHQDGSTKTNSDMELPILGPIPQGWTSEDQLQGISGSQTFETTTSYRPVSAEPPDFGRLRMITCCLLLTTFLAVGAAWDANQQCIDEEIYYWVEYTEDDQFDENATYEGKIECLEMFFSVIIPVGAVTWVFGLLSLCLIYRHLRYLETLAENLVPSHLAVLLQLFVSLLIIGVMWTYGNFSIMLKPKRDPNAYFQNPYKSLAAVDHMGHIGENANLYYLSWMSQTLILVVLYQVSIDCCRWVRRGFQPVHSLSGSNTFSDAISMHERIQSMLAYTSARNLVFMYKQRRKTWYKFMVRLRKRTAFWVAAFFLSVLVHASSAYLYVQILLNLAININGDDSFRYRDVCSIVKGDDSLPKQFCFRSSFAVVAGAVATVLCMLAMLLHMFVRRRAALDESAQSCTVLDTHVIPGAMYPDNTRSHLRMEFLLSLCLFVLLGFNAVLATGVQGPAAEVGNLYYASWLSFLVCLRICLGCLEELYYIQSSNSDLNASSPAAVPKVVQPNLSAPVPASVESESSSLSSSQLNLDMDNYKRMAKLERPDRLRRYFFEWTFSFVCAASAYDAAYNQETACTPQQKYVIIAPAAVAFMSMILFFLCLNPISYVVISHICVGGVVSVITFIVWLLSIIITLHSEDSWAVNRIGEMKLANLYYFSWASIVVAALQMISYIKPFFGEKSKDVMILVWATIVKVCMVILGASLHVWHNVAETCVSELIDEGEDTAFCYRTKFSIAVAVVGVFSGWTVVGTRILGCCPSATIRNRFEALLSFCLVVLFGLAVALITSIGGPGQSVGDLYYATWLSFWVCIGIFVSCYEQMRRNEVEYRVNHTEQDQQKDGEYVNFEDDDETSHR